MFAFKVAVLAARDTEDVATQGDVTYHRFRGTFTFAQVARTVAEMLPRTKAERKVVLEYADEDGDVVRIASELEWNECLRLQAAAAAPTAATAVVIRLTARWGERARKAAGDVQDVPEPTAAPASASTPTAVAPSEVVAAEHRVATPIDSVAETSVVTTVPPCVCATSAADFDSLSDDDFVAQRASRDDERFFDKEQQYIDKVANVTTMTPAVAQLALAAPPSAPTGDAADLAARPWNNVKANAKVLHAVFPDTPLKSIQAMLRKRRNNVNEVADLLARGISMA